MDLAFIQEAERGLVEGEKGADFKSCCLQMFLHAVKVLISRQQSERSWFEQYLFVHFDESPVPKKASPNKNLPNLPVHWHNGITLLLIFGSLQGYEWIQYPVENHLAACICGNLRIYPVNTTSSNVAKLSKFQTQDQLNSMDPNWQFQVKSTFLVLLLFNEALQCDGFLPKLQPATCPWGPSSEHPPSNS